MTSSSVVGSPHTWDQGPGGAGGHYLGWMHPLWVQTRETLVLEGLQGLNLLEATDRKEWRE